LTKFTIHPHKSINLKDSLKRTPGKWTKIWKWKEKIIKLLSSWKKLIKWKTWDEMVVKNLSMSGKFYIK